jgi:putative restriction endonuclease
MLNPLSKLIGFFDNLHRNQNPRWGWAPHKPILLLAMLDEIDRGNIQDNFIEITPDLVASFRAYWRILVPPDTWHEKISYPFRFLVQDGFWELIKDGAPVSTHSLGYHPTLRQLTTEVDGARLDLQLWQLLQDPSALSALRSFLLKRYFNAGIADVDPNVPARPVDYEIERLKAQAQNRFRIRGVRDSSDEVGYYVRHALFPKVIKALYNDACAVCRIAVGTEEGSGLVDAAHIMPFGQFHNDDPRNGIALCKNHHWGFDAGWFSITADYKIVVSSRLQNASNYILQDAVIALPDRIEFSPAPEALAWHRANVFNR